MKRKAADWSPIFDASAMAIASLVGGLVLLARAVPELNEPFSSVAYLVLLLPILAIASGIVLSVLVLPAWWLARKVGAASLPAFPLAVAVMVGLPSFAWLPYSELQLIDSMLGCIFVVLWCGVMAAAYAFFAEARPNPSVKGTSCGGPQAAPYVER